MSDALSEFVERWRFKLIDRDDSDNTVAVNRP